MKCPKCNFEVQENSKFCPECGGKIPELTIEQAPNTPPAQTSNATTNSATDNKKEMNKKVKKIVIISISSFLACAIIFLVLFLLNPACMFGHGDIHHELVKESTCTMPGAYDAICNDCGKRLGGYSKEALGHDFGTIVCGVESSCSRCGEKQVFQHEADFTDYCKNCGQYEYIINLPIVPLTISDYDQGQNNTITNITVEEDYSDIKVKFTVTCSYSLKGDKYSQIARFVYKIYDANGTVVKSGTAYSVGAICVGEQSMGEITIYESDLTPWENYTLKIINIS